MEQWVDIDGYEGLYQVSNKGNVRSCDRIINSKCNSKRLCKGKPIKPYEDEDGYMRVGLHKNDTQKVVGIHRLVADAFIPNTNNLPSVDHIDGNPNNNIVENLRWITIKGNNSTAIAKSRKSVSAFKRKDNKKKIIQNTSEGVFLAEYNSTMDAERVTNVNHSAIIRCCKGKQKIAGGYIWKYKN